MTENCASLKTKILQFILLKKNTCIKIYYKQFFKQYDSSSAHFVFTSEF